VLSVAFEGRFLDIDHLKDTIYHEFPEKVPQANQNLGYIEPGHGVKGRQRWISSPSDLTLMYQAYKKKEIILWTYEKDENDTMSDTTSAKRRRTADDSGKAESLAQKTTEVDEIYESLYEKHSSSYSIEQLRAWAHMIQMRKCDSYDSPPNKPFFRSKSLKSGSSSSGTQSPGKKIVLRSQCIDQLQKWHTLLESGAITREQYDDLQVTILDDIKQLKN